MARINLRDVFPVYEPDCYVDVPDGDVDAFIASLTREIADMYIAFERAESAYLRRMFWYKAHYSLDLDDGIENAVLHPPLSPAEIYEQKLTVEQLCAAIACLPEKQAKRVYAHFILGMSNATIARAEGVHKSQITRSIRKGLHGLKIFLEREDF